MNDKVKEDTDIIIKEKGLCLKIVCDNCTYDVLCSNRIGTVSNLIVYAWAIKVRDNNYNFDSLLFDEAL